MHLIQPPQSASNSKRHLPFLTEPAHCRVQPAQSIHTGHDAILSRSFWQRLARHQLHQLPIPSITVTPQGLR